ncbi:MAG: nitroreductase family protein [Candidatus Aenigmatarchaeota archaeon]
MNVFEAIEKRKSVRKYRNIDVDLNKIITILEYSILAPCAGNVQEWRFIVVNDKKIKEELAEASYNQDFIAEAPYVIVICADEKEIYNAYGKRGKERYMYMDCSFAAANIILSAVSLGLDTCIVGAFEDEKVSKILNLPENIKPIFIVPIGYAAEDPTRPLRKPISSIIFYNTYGKKLK